MKIIRSKVDGHINVASTMKSFKAELDKRLKEEENIRDDSYYKDAVMAVISETQGFNVSREFLIQSVIRKLMESGGSYSDMRKRVEQHIRFNSHEKGYLQQEGYRVKLRA